MLDLRIDGGLVAQLSNAPQRASIGIKDGMIVALGELGDVPARETLDVSGALIMPGFIDTHVHLGFTDRDLEWSTETQQAAIGGVTMPLIYFRDTARYDENLAQFIETGRQNSHTDFVVHLGILNDDHLDEFDTILNRFAIRSIKMYTTYKDGSLSRFGVVGQDDGFILDVMRRAAARGDIVVNVHCENDDIVRRGQTHWARDVVGAAEQWAAMRPPIAEVEAIRRICLLARETGARVHLPHVSSQRAIETALAERQLGTEVSIESCPQYLMPKLATATGSLAKVNPPVRPEENGSRLWQALRAGELDTLGTDHACWCRADKTADDVLSVAAGFPGLGTLVPLMMDSVHRELISTSDLVRMNLRAAEVFALDRRGQIQPGYHADLVVVDPTATRDVTPEALGGLSDFSPWENHPLTGWPVMTLLRGQIIAQDGKIVGPPTGTYARAAYRG
ncbi:dihydroorotase [Jatrophihabitans sp. DSM 45814]